MVFERDDEVRINQPIICDCGGMIIFALTIVAMRRLSLTLPQRQS